MADMEYGRLPSTRSDSSTATHGIQEPDDPAPQDLDLRTRKLVFLHIIILQVLVNYDSGAIAAALDRLSARDPPGFDLSLTESGLLSSLVYMGLSFSSLLAAPLLQRYESRFILLATLGLNVWANAMFAWAHDKHTLLASRFLVGMSQSALVVYAPIWVDEFAPPDACTLWMSLMQAGVPLGVMAGYLVSGLLTAYMPDLDPRWPFRIQVFLLAPAVLALLLVRKPYINTRLYYAHTEEIVSDLPESDHIRHNRVDTFDVSSIRSMTVWEQILHLASNPVYLFTVLALSALYFVVTGIQLWITAYLVQYILPLYGGFTKSEVVYAFAFTSATGPILGVLFGGWVTDKMGGYRGHRGVRDAARLAAGFGVFAVACALPVIWATQLYSIIMLVWSLLFFGGAILPPAVGILMSCVPRNMRSFSSGASNLFYNWLGYFLGPTLTGIVSDMYGGVQYGMILCLGWSIFGFVFMLLAWFAAQWRYARHKGDEALSSSDQLDSDSYDVMPEKSEIEYEMARERRYSLVIHPTRAASPAPGATPSMPRSRVTRSDTNLLRGREGQRYGSFARSVSLAEGRGTDGSAESLARPPAYAPLPEE